VAVFIVVAFIIFASISPIVFRVVHKGTIIPPFAVVKSDTLAVPTISSDAFGDELPIPIRAFEPPVKYILLCAFVLVPICASGVILLTFFRTKLEDRVVIPSILTAPTISSVDFGDVLPIPTLPFCNIQKLTIFVELLSILNIPLLLTRLQL
jgi:hypothetical protein